MKIMMKNDHIGNTQLQKHILKAIHSHNQSVVVMGPLGSTGLYQLFLVDLGLETRIKPRLKTD